MKTLRCSQCDQLLVQYDKIKCLHIACPECGQAHTNMFLSVQIGETLNSIDGKLAAPRLATYFRRDN